MNAASENELHVVTELMSKYSAGVDDGNTSKDGMTTLQAACRNGHVPVIELLLCRGADMEKEDEKGRRAIYPAVKGGVNPSIH